MRVNDGRVAPFGGFLASLGFVHERAAKRLIHRYSERLMNHVS